MNMKKVLSGMLALAMVGSMSMTAFAADYYYDQLAGTTAAEIALNRITNDKGESVFTGDVLVPDDSYYIQIGPSISYDYLLKDEKLVSVKFDKEGDSKMIKVGSTSIVEKKINGTRTVCIKFTVAPDYTDKEFKGEFDIIITAKENLTGVMPVGQFPQLAQKVSTGGSTDSGKANFEAAKSARSSAQRVAEKARAAQAAAIAADGLNMSATPQDPKAAAYATAHAALNAEIGVYNAITVTGAGGATQGSFTPVTVDTGTIDDTVEAAKYDTLLDAVNTTTGSVAKELAQLELIMSAVSSNVGGAGFLNSGDRLIIPVKFYISNTVLDGDQDVVAGKSGAVIKPVKNEDNEIVWHDENKDISRLTFFGDSDVAKFFPKLSTKWDNQAYAAYFRNTDAFLFDFISNPKISSTSRATLELYNPFVDEDGDEVVSVDNIRIYTIGDVATAGSATDEFVEAVGDGRLVDITDQFTYSQNDDGEYVFTTKTRVLGTYIAVDVEGIEFDEVGDVIPDEEAPDDTNAPTEKLPPITGNF